MKHAVSVESSSLLLHSIKRNLCVYHDEFIDELEGYHANRTTNKMFCTTSETEGEDVHVKLV